MGAAVRWPDDGDSVEGERVRVGEVCVDSGQVMIVDPCYVMDTDSETFGAVCDVTTTGPRFGEFLAAGVAGMGVASSSGYGDGVYDVYADVVDGCVARLVIEFMRLTPVGVSRRSPDA